MTAAAPPLAPDLTEGLRRLKLATMRRLAPELLLTARTQRWAPEELLRTLVEAEISARDASNARTRMKAAAFPVTKTLDEFDLGPKVLGQLASDGNVGTVRDPGFVEYSEGRIGDVDRDTDLLLAQDAIEGVLGRRYLCCEHHQDNARHHED